MEPAIRGYIEQLIDTILSDEYMVLTQLHIRNLKPYVKSLEDGAFGFILGTIVANCFASIFITRGRALTDDEMSEFVKIINEKIPRIRSRILETLV